jgi:hypothetical protein
MWMERFIMRSFAIWIFSTDGVGYALDIYGHVRNEYRNLVLQSQSERPADDLDLYGKMGPLDRISLGEERDNFWFLVNLSIQKKADFFLQTAQLFDSEGNGSQRNSVVFSLQANYTDWATATCWRLVSAVDPSR